MARIICRYRKNAGRHRGLVLIGDVGADGTVRECHEMERRLVAVSRDFQERFTASDFRADALSAVCSKIVWPQGEGDEPEHHAWVNLEVGRPDWLDGKWKNSPDGLITPEEDASVVAFFAERGIDVALE